MKRKSNQNSTHATRASSKAEPIDTDEPLDRFEIIANGAVRRHIDRGAVEPSQGVMRARADAASRAGRNPSYGQQAR